MTIVIGHRGASAYAPENTMPAIELAQRQGADMVEIDLQRSADGEIVVFHDELTQRWDGQKRRVTDCTLAELRQLSIGGAQIATLVEVCQFVRQHNLRVNVELKGLGFAPEMARILHEERVEELILISSFAPQALAEAAAACPHIPRAYLMGTETLRPDVRFRESWPLLALKRNNAHAWHPAYQIPLLERVIPVVQRAGYRVNVWTVNDPMVMRRLIQVGADGIITDRPDLLREVLAETGT